MVDRSTDNQILNDIRMEGYRFSKSEWKNSPVAYHIIPSIVMKGMMHELNLANLGAVHSFSLNGDYHILLKVEDLCGL